MDTAYLHIITNHIPIIGLPFALAVLALGFWRKSDDLSSVAFLAFTLLGAAAIVVYLTGQGGEDFVEHVAGVNEDAIDAHEEFAKFALGAILLTAAVSAFAFFRYGGYKILFRDAAARSYPTWAAISVIVLGIVSAGMAGYTGKLGGKIRHTEFYGTAGADTGNGDEEGGDERGRNRRGRDQRD